MAYAANICWDVSPGVLFAQCGICVEVSAASDFPGRDNPDQSSGSAMEDLPSVQAHLSNRRASSHLFLSFSSPNVHPNPTPPNRLRIQKPWLHALRKLLGRRQFMRFDIRQCHEEDIAGSEACAGEGGAGHSMRHGFVKAPGFCVKAGECSKGWMCRLEDDVDKAVQMICLFCAVFICERECAYLVNMLLRCEVLRMRCTSLLTRGYFGDLQQGCYAADVCVGYVVSLL